MRRLPAIRAASLTSSALMCRSTATSFGLTSSHQTTTAYTGRASGGLQIMKDLALRVGPMERMVLTVGESGRITCTRTTAGQQTGFTSSTTASSTNLILACGTIVRVSYHQPALLKV